MARGKPYRRYTGNFKQEVVEAMMREKMGYRETARKYEIADRLVANWERIYLEEGPEGLYIERRGRNSKGRPRKELEAGDKEDLQAEVERLRAENAYLKKLNVDLQFKCNTKAKKSVTHGGKPLRMVFADNKERGKRHASLQTSYHRRAGKAIPNEKFRV